MLNFSWPLGRIVTAAIAALVFFMAITMGWVVGQRSVEQVEQQNGRVLAEIARQMVDRLQNNMRYRNTEISVLAELPGIRNKDHAQKLVDTLKAKDRWLAWTGLVDNSGNVIAGSDGVLHGKNIANRPVYDEAMKNKNFMGDVHEAVLLNSLLTKPGEEPLKFVDVSAKIFDASGQPWGVLAAHFNWKWANTLVTSLLEPIKDMPGLEIIVIARDDTVILGPANMIGKKLTTVSATMPDDGSSGWISEEWPGEGKYLSGYASQVEAGDGSNMGWTAIARQPLSSAYRVAYAIQKEIIFFGCLFTVAFSIIGWMFASSIAHPLKKIAVAADSLRDGSTHTEIPYVRGALEIESLSNSIREMVSAITNKKRELAYMTTIAEHDRLTNLPNRRQLEQHMQMLGQNKQTMVFILYMDLDGFKPINDTWGHDVGDSVLKIVADRIKHCLRTEDLPVRLGGDEFVVVLGDAISEQSALTVAQRIIDRIHEPMNLEGKALQIGCSVGFTIWNTVQEDSQTALARADHALYQAKSMGKGRIFQE